MRAHVALRREHARHSEPETARRGVRRFAAAPRARSDPSTSPDVAIRQGRRFRRHRAPSPFRHVVASRLSGNASPRRFRHAWHTNGRDTGFGTDSLSSNPDATGASVGPSYGFRIDSTRVWVSAEPGRPSIQPVSLYSCFGAAMSGIDAFGADGASGYPPRLAIRSKCALIAGMYFSSRSVCRFCQRRRDHRISPAL